MFSRPIARVFGWKSIGLELRPLMEKSFKYHKEVGIMAIEK